MIHKYPVQWDGAAVFLQEAAVAVRIGDFSGVDFSACQKEPAYTFNNVASAVQMPRHLIEDKQC